MLFLRRKKSIYAMKIAYVFLIASVAILGLPSCGSDDTPTPAPINPPGPDPEPEPEPEPQPEEGLVFFDDFKTFDSESWTKESHLPHWVNNEIQSYVTSAVTTSTYDGKSVLKITATRTSSGITSGRVNSKFKKSFKYGRIVASICMPKTFAGLWPAFWMMGDVEDEWPKCGEIDIVEMGQQEGIRKGTSEKLVNTAIHYGETADTHVQEYEQHTVAKSLQDGKFHTYEMKWTAEQIVISIDDVTFHTFNIKDNPYFHHNFHILFNLAAGGDFPHLYDLKDITALASGPQSMYIDWVKVYEK